MGALASRPLAVLSGGQRQRVFLAQGIVRKPDILLLDEPAAGLDRESIARTQDILVEEAARGAAVVCVTHHESAVSAADRVIRLDHGMLTR
jgi:zinc/manganese transport system ATP-binding protein